MALVTRSTKASMDSERGRFMPHLAGDLYAGEDLDPAAPCYIKASDGKVYMSNGTGANEAARVHGFTPTAYKAGDPVALFGPGTMFRYSDGNLTPGQPLYVGATKGRLDTAATTGDDAGVAFAIDAYDIAVARLKTA